MAEQVDEQRLFDAMRYIPPTADSKRQFEAVQAAMVQAYHVLLTVCPASAERTLAIRKLQETRMWAGAAIAFDGRSYPL